MLTYTYITAIATAITLSITPIVVSKSSRENIQVTWSKENRASRVQIQIANIISLVDQRPVYFLSNVEQGALKRALFRSVKIIEPHLA